MSTFEKCDKCDGAHATGDCPYFPGERFEDAATRALSVRAATGTARKYAEEENKQPEPEDAASLYLENLSQAQRDTVLEAISYVNMPIVHYFGENNLSPQEDILNYTQLFSEIHDDLTLKYSLPKPTGNTRLRQRPVSLMTIYSELRNGDRIQFGEYRGTGTKYVLWLRAGAHTNKSETAEDYSLQLELNKRPCRFTHHEQAPDPQTHSVPHLVSREADGPHNDPNYECFLFPYPDEYGWSPSSAVAMPTNYFMNEIVMGVIDPLLVPSQSEYGQLVTRAKLTEEFADDNAFPTKYVGYIDENDSPELQWVLLADAESAYDAPGDYFINIRRVLARHFEIVLGGSS
jgi:hypothetical protein